MADGIVASVVLEKTVYRFDKPFDYSVPAGLVSACLPGVRVTVPFGRGNATRIGLVLTVRPAEPGQSSSPNNGLKALLTVEDESPILPPDLLAAVGFLREHTFCTYYDAVKCMLPFGLSLKIAEYIEPNPAADCKKIAALSYEGGKLLALLRQKAKKGPCQKGQLLAAAGLNSQSPAYLELLKSGAAVLTEKARQNMQDPTVSMVRLCQNGVLPKLTPKQQAVVQFLSQNGAAGAKEVLYFTGVTAAVLKALQKKGVLTFYSAPALKYQQEQRQSNAKITLTAEQQAAFNSLQGCLNKGEPCTALLYGVTGSGKTSVFLRLVDEALSRQKSVIVMVPEIALTPQTLGRFRARYGSAVAVFHSAMPLGKRREEYLRAKSGAATVAIGTRSAVFAPVQNLGLIIMDEEQEHTYKSEQSPRFHAREVARFRCRQNGALLLLGSATPSVESFSLAKSGKYKLVTLPHRYGSAVLPQVLTVDMRRELAAGNTGVFSRRLALELEQTLQNKRQAIILLNRRGHNTYVSCPGCGKVMTCPNCSISLTYHSANHRLMCHYCGASFPLTGKCPQCGGETLRFSGAGTQKAVEELTALFPKARVLRLDADTTLTRDAFEKGMSAFANGEYDIMLGTQMVAKGLDFPRVTLVGVLSADQSMYSDDYRSFERTFSLLTQVIGRSGRGEEHGIALVQTTDPESELIALACAQDYESFYQTEIATRRLMIYPPYCDLVQVVVTAESLGLAKQAALQFFEQLKQTLAQTPQIKIIILGPAPALVVKVSTRYRYRLILKVHNTAAFRALMRGVLQQFYQAQGSNALITVDVNPESIV